MTDIRQNFSLMQGDDMDVDFDISAAAGSAIDLSQVQSLTWMAYAQEAMIPTPDVAVITKDLPGGGITIIDPIAMTFTVHLAGADTVSLDNGNYVHRVELVDKDGRHVTPTLGVMTVIDIDCLPNVVSFKTLFPEFAAVDDTSVQIALDECTQYVDANWGQYQNTATMYLAAHFLSVSAEGGETGGQIITSERIGQVAVTYAAAQQVGKAGSMLQNTIYCRQFYYLLRINSGGIAIV